MREPTPTLTADRAARLRQTVLRWLDNSGWAWDLELSKVLCWLDWTLEEREHAA